MRRIKLSRNPAIRTDFLAHMVWPNDAEKRVGYVELYNDASIAFLAAAQRESRFRDNFADGHYDIWTKAVRNAFADEVCNPEIRSESIAQGFGIKALDEEMQSRLAHMHTAAFVVVALVTMIQHHKSDPRLRGGPGIKKAQELIADVQKLALTTVESAWLEYKTVSHFLCAALVLGECKIVRFYERIIQPDKELIEASQFYRLILTTFIPKRRAVPLVDPEDLWLPPLEWECNGTELIGSPLPDDLLNGLANRKAR